MVIWKTIAIILTAAALAAGLSPMSVQAQAQIPSATHKTLEKSFQLRPGDRDILFALARKISDGYQLREGDRSIRADHENLPKLVSSLRTILASSSYTYHDIIYLKRYGVNLANLSDRAISYGHYREAAFAYHLGRKNGEINWESNNSKPKALIIAGEDDPNEAFAPSPDYVRFFRQIQKHYNVRFRVVSNPVEFCKEIDEAAKEGSIELLIVAGHGSPQTIRLGSESRILTSSELPDSRVLNKLAPNAVIFLESCETGAGKEYNNNIANYFANHAPGRVVIAPITPVTIQMEKAFFHPHFDGKFIGEYGEDLTYRIDPSHSQQDGYCVAGYSACNMWRSP